VPTRQRSATDLLPVNSLALDGLLTRSDGALVRYLDVTPTNPLALDEPGCARMTRGFTDLITRIPAGMSIQCYAQATPVSTDALLEHARAETDAATNPLASSPDPDLRGRAKALRRLAHLHERSVEAHAGDQAALDVRFLLVVPWLPDVEPPMPGALRLPRPPRRRRPNDRTPEEHGRAARDSLQHTERLRSALAGLDMSARLLSGFEVAQLLHHRFTAALPNRHIDAPEILSGLDDRDHATRAATRLKQAICQGDIDTTDRRHLTIAGQLEQTLHLSRTPERTFYGWLLHAMQNPAAWTLSVHVHTKDRATERDRFNRRARRLWGVNEGAAERAARPDRRQHDQQHELEELVEELSTGAQTMTDVSVYMTVRARTEDELGEAVQAATRDLATVTDAGVSTGDAAQLPLWISNLPLGLDRAERTVGMISRNAADTMPFLSTSCGSPSGIPFAFADPGRTLERLNPFDRTHDNGTTLLFAKSGGGKTMTTIALTSAALPRGCQVNVLDRSAGHYRLLTDLIPGAAHLELGKDEQATINPWDVDDPSHLPRGKVAFLVRLHALLIGDHDAETDAYGLQPLERNLLALAIRATYENAEHPSESALQGELRRLADAEPEGAENQAVYRNLAHRLTEVCGDGTYGYLFDRPTTIAAEDAPLVVFNTRHVPDDVAAPLLFAVLEFVSRRVERRFEQHVRGLADGREQAGPFDGMSCIVIEELWKLVERKATGAWVNELVKRARHIGLWFVAITQQRSDLAGAQGRALLDNSTIQLFLRNGPDDVEHIARALHLSPEEVDQISRLTTEKGSHAQAYVVNGERGRGAVTIRLGSEVYWLATSDPVDDVPWRELALDEAGFNDAADHVTRSEAAFSALEKLADPTWHESRSS
jgi:hypothetical protein